MWANKETYMHRIVQLEQFGVWKQLMDEIVHQMRHNLAQYRRAQAKCHAIHIHE